MQTEQKEVEGFIVNLLTIGFSREQVAQKAYDYAVALQTDTQPKDGNVYVSARMMDRAAAWVSYALPNAYRIYERSNQMR